MANALKQIENDYRESLEEQDEDLNFQIRDGSSSITSACVALFDESGVDCKILHLGDNQWQKGIVRIRMEVEFIPDTDSTDEPIEPSLDEFRE